MPLPAMKDTDSRSAKLRPKRCTLSPRRRCSVPHFVELGSLWPHIVAVLALSAAIFFVVLHFTAKLTLTRRNVAGLLIVASILGYGFLLADSPALIAIVPITNVVVYGNFLPLLCALLAGVLCSDTAVPLWRRIISGTLLLAFCVISLLYPLRGECPPTHNNIVKGECIQTSQTTCSPAVAVNLLAFHGIKATESEMCRLCLTTREGTRLAGLYRGLRIKTAGTQFKVMVRKTDIEDLRRHVTPPAILSVRLNAETSRREPKYVSTWGWTEGVAHCVLFLGFTNETTVTMSDPSYGQEPWNIDAVKDLWTGQIVQLVRQ
ncbi:MAG: hypothetical protein C0404_13815 [Verrucomicrobia bacterium]|nr:hypothetical protein [Verrucomicrobiota bacterium]